VILAESLGKGIPEASWRADTTTNGQIPWNQAIPERGTRTLAVNPKVCLSHKEDRMLRLRTWIYRYSLLAVLVLTAGAGLKW
jgi:hypothetical protein